MHLPIRRGLAVLLLLATAALPPVPPASAQLPVRLAFDAYAGGLFLVRGEVTLALGERGYRLGLEATGGHIVDFFTRFSYRAHGDGAMERGRVLPERFIGERSLRGRTDVVVLRHDPSGAIDVTYRPPSEDLEKVPAGLRRDALDPIAAAVAVIASVRSGAGCSGVWPVYDGRRRYDLASAGRGEDVLRPSRYSSFSGPAQRCALTMRPVAGFDPPWKGTILRAGVERTADVWFGPVGPGRELLPVRIQVDLDWGSLVMHLTGVETGG